MRVHDGVRSEEALDPRRRPRWSSDEQLRGFIGVVQVCRLPKFLEALHEVGLGGIPVQTRSIFACNRGTMW